MTGGEFSMNALDAAMSSPNYRSEIWIPVVSLRRNDTIYAKWLPESGQKLRDYHCFEKYLNNPGKTPPEKLKTEIYVPIE